jgi:hypothetical protein
MRKPRAILVPPTIPSIPQPHLSFAVIPSLFPFHTDSISFPLLNGLRTPPPPPLLLRPPAPSPSSPACYLSSAATSSTPFCPQSRHRHEGLRRRRAGAWAPPASRLPHGREAATFPLSAAGSRAWGGRGAGAAAIGAARNSRLPRQPSSRPRRR